MDERENMILERIKRLCPDFPAIPDDVEEDVLSSYAEMKGMRYFGNLVRRDVDNLGFDAAFHSSFSAEFRRLYATIPVARSVEGGREIYHCICSNPFDGSVQSVIESRVSGDAVMKMVSGNYVFVNERYDVALYLAPKKRILALDSQLSSGAKAVVESEETKTKMEKILEEILDAAFTRNASDVHITTLHSEGGMQVKFRVDGDMTDYARESDITATEYDILTNLVMNLAKMDATQKRIPQDGLLPWIWRRRDYEIRTASIPVENFSLKANFNKIQFRLLRSDMKITLDQIGLSPLEMEIVKGMISQPSGMTVCTGPTSSGKTTTIYAILHTMDMEKQVCYTVENPVEYRLQGATQIKVDEKSGNTFQFILKSLMRLDPDIVFIGEMRDVESARMATQISNTGHTVYSTLHTNNSYSAPQRLVSMGLEPYLVSSNLTGVISQRLVKKNCPHCLEEYEPSARVMKLLNLERGKWYKSAGTIKGAPCPHCLGKGTIGRMGIYELLPLYRLTDWEDKMDDPRKLKQMSLEAGFPDLLQSAVEKMKLGLTSPDYVAEIMSRALES